MALPSNIKVTKAEVSQTIDLQEIAGVDLSGDPALMGAIGQALVDKIVERTKSGKDINNKALKAYKKSYKESDQFEAFAKDNKVDMELSGNMLSDIDLETPNGSVKIFMGTPLNTLKAFNHITGDTVTQREWFGLRDSDVEDVLASFSQEIAEAKDEPTDEIGQFIKNIRNGGELSTAAAQEGSVLISIRDLFGQNDG